MLYIGIEIQEINQLRLESTQSRNTFVNSACEDRLNTQNLYSEAMVVSAQNGTGMEDTLMTTNVVWGQYKPPSQSIDC